MSNFNTKAHAKLVKIKKLNLLRLVVSFDTCNNITQRNAAYVSGDITIDDVMRCLDEAKKICRTDNIILVGPTPK